MWWTSVNCNAGAPAGKAGIGALKMTVSETRVHYAWIVLVISTLAVFGALGLARFGYGVVLPAMQAGLTLSNTESGLMVTVNLAGYLIMSVAGGALAARFGPRVVVSLGLLLAGLGMLATGLAGSFQTASLAGLLVGLGSGGGNVPVMALLTAWFSRRQRGLAAGIAVGGSSIGLILVGPLVPRLLSLDAESGWRISWFLFSAITIGLALLSAAALRNRPAELGLAPVGAEAATSAFPLAEGLAWGRVYRSVMVWHLGLVYFAFGFAYIVYTTFFSKYQ